MFRRTLFSWFVLSMIVASSQAQISRPEHPQPQSVRAEWLNLNGPWLFGFDPGNSGEQRGMVERTDYGKTITVPFCMESTLSGIGYKDFMPCVWYRRDFDLPQGWQGRRVLLHFGAVDYEASVWLNGKLLGTHLGGYTPFKFEITNALQPGRNTIVLRARDDTRSFEQASGKQCYDYESSGVHYTRTTGIWQTVWLEAVGDTYLSSFKVLPEIITPSITVVPRFDGPTGDMSLELTARADGKVAGKAVFPAATGRPVLLKLKEKHLWAAGKPYLYDLELKLVRSGQVVDKVDSYFGLREVRVEGNRVLINGEPVFQRLVLDQGFYPDGIYTAPDDEALKRDIELSLAVGFNGARLHQKVFEPRFLYWADRLGYLTWGEFPSWGLDLTAPVTLERMLPEWLEAVERDFNHPSIIIWTPFNETPRQQRPGQLRAVYLATRAADPTRPVHDTSGYVHVQTDIFSVHCYEGDTTRFRENFEPSRGGGKIWQTRPDNDSPYFGQPYIVSEFGGIWWNPGQQDGKAWGYGDRPQTESDFFARYRSLTGTLLGNPNMFGFCYTQLYDIEQEVNGLYTYDRKPKFDVEMIRRINAGPAAYEQQK